MTYTWIQGTSTSNGAGSTNTMNLTLGGAIGSGHLVIVTFAAAGFLSGDSITITDNKGNTYTNAYTPLVTASGFSYAMVTAYAVNVINGPQTFTGTDNTNVGTFLSLTVDEFSGAGALDVAAHASSQTNPGTGTDAATSGSITTATNGDLVYGIGLSVGGTGYTAAGTGFAYVQNGVLAGYYTEYLTQAAHGAIAATFTDGGGASDVTLIAVLAFKPAVVVPVLGLAPLNFILM
jgi:hypothetical protein